jgi:hypothetical protein
MRWMFEDAGGGLDWRCLLSILVVKLTVNRPVRVLKTRLRVCGLNRLMMQSLAF